MSNTNPGPQGAPVTVVVLTFNEQDNIAACLESCAWCDDVHIIDSGSTDETCTIARSFGAKVHQNPFTSFGAQRNWAIDNIDAKHSWQFHLDADERFTRPLVREIQAELGADGTLSTKAGYFVASKLIFMNRWLRYSGGYPTYQMRLLHTKRCRFTDFGHGQRELTDGELGHLKNPYLHYNFSKGLTDWLSKHNAYSSQEAVAQQAHRQSGRELLQKIFRGGSVVERRRALKGFSYLLPGRSIFRFLYTYLLRSGWRDGSAGFQYCALLAMYDYWTELKVQEMKRANMSQLKE